MLKKSELENLAKNMVVKYCNCNYFKNTKEINTDDVSILKSSRNWNTRIIKLSIQDGKKIRYFKIKYNYYTTEIISYEYKRLGVVKRDDVINDEFK